MKQVSTERSTRAVW